MPVITRCPGSLNSFVNLCWVIGHIIGAGVLTGLVGDKTVWGWKIPLALQVGALVVHLPRPPLPLESRS
jgi:hypothetical protein